MFKILRGGHTFLKVIFKNAKLIFKQNKFIVYFRMFEMLFKKIAINSKEWRCKELVTFTAQN